MRIVIGEDEVLLREGMRLMLERGDDSVVAEAGDAVELVRKVRAHRPDLVITDIRMPPDNTDDGLRAALEIRHEFPETRLLLLSQHVQRSYAEELLASDPTGVGYLLKHRIADAKSFRSDLDRIRDGGTVLDPEVVAVILGRPRADDSPIARLTSRQLEVLALMAEGFSNAAIAERLTITDKAVVRHASHIYDTLGLTANVDEHRRVLAVLMFLTDN